MGLVDGGYSSSELWQVVKPVASTNLITCPSFEVSTTGWTATSGAITRVAGGKFGAWMLRLLASATNGRASTSLGTLAGSTQVVTSKWVKADSALVVLRLTLGAVTFDQAHPGDGLWHRLEIAGTTVGSVACTAEVRDTRTSAWTNVDIDGAMAETGRLVATSYIDGDQDGCLWNGAAGLSTSTRSGRDGRGGEIVSLESLGLLVMQNMGIGAPPVEVETQESALSDGELFQRSRNKPRVITLMSMIEGDGGLASLHTIRRSLMDVLRPDARTNRGPIMLRYSASAVPKLLPAYYQSGLEMDGIEAADEKIPLRLIAPDPDFVAETDDQTSLTVSALTVSRIAYRDADGAWSGLGTGQPATPVTDLVNDVVKLGDGSLVAGGSFVNMGGVANADYLARWDGTAWAEVGGSVANGTVWDLLSTRSGALWVAGDFTNLGSANGDYIARYVPDTGWSNVSTGADARVQGLAEDPLTGYIWAVGSFTTIGGVSAAGAAYWNGTTWVSVAASRPTLGSEQCLEFGPDGRAHLMTGAGVYVWTGSAWALLSAISPTSGPGALLSTGGYLYAAGTFTTIGGVSANRVARYNGVVWEALGAGVSAGTVYRLAVSKTGTIYAAGQGWGTVGGVTPPDNVAEWNGSTWSPFPANPPDTGTHANDFYFIFGHSDGSVTVTWTAPSGTFGTSMAVPGRTTVTNSGSSVAYPVIKIETTGLIYHLRNATTSQTITFNALSGAINGMVTIDLRPGRKTIRGVTGGNLMPSVLPGSDLSTFGLVPGDNVIELYASGTVTANMRYRARYWSAD